MANRNWASGGKIYSMHVSPVLIDATFTIGGTGAVTGVVGPLVTSVTRTGTGIYRLNLQNNFNGLFMALGSAQSPNSGLSGVATIEIQNSPNTNVTSLATPTLTIKTLDAAGAVVDPASGSKISILAYLSNSSIQIAGE